MEPVISFAYTEGCCLIHSEQLSCHLKLECQMHNKDFALVIFLSQEQIWEQSENAKFLKQLRPYSVIKTADMEPSLNRWWHNFALIMFYYFYHAPGESVNHDLTWILLQCKYTEYICLCQTTALIKIILGVYQLELSPVFKVRKQNHQFNSSSVLAEQLKSF